MKNLITRLEQSQSEHQTPEEHLAELNSRAFNNANEVITTVEKSGPFGLVRRHVTTLANPELHKAMLSHEREKTKIVTEIELFQMEKRGQLVKAQCVLQLQNMVARYAQEKNQENLERVNQIIEKVDAEHLALQQRVAQAYSEAFSDAEKVPNEFVRQRLMHALERRVDTMLLSFDEQCHRLIASFRDDEDLLNL